MSRRPSRPVLSTCLTNRLLRPGYSASIACVRSARRPSRAGTKRDMWSSTKESIARSISRMALKFPPFTVGWSIQNTLSPRTDLTAICAPASFLPSQISPSVYSGAMRLISSRHTHTASRVMNCAEANPRWFNCAARVSARSATDLRVVVVLTLLGSARLVMVPLALALRRFFLFPGAALALNGVFVRCGSSVRRSSSPGSVAGVSSRGSSFRFAILLQFRLRSLAILLAVLPHSQHLEVLRQGSIRVFLAPP